MAQDDRLEAHVRTDEVAELVGRDLAKTFKSRDFRMCAERLDGVDTFLVGVAITRLLLVSHAEKRSLQYLQVPAANHVGVELQEEGEHQQTDVHAVNIGIGGYDDIVISQILNAFVYI